MYYVYIAYGCSPALVEVDKDFTTIVCTCSLGGPRSEVKAQSLMPRKAPSVRTKQRKIRP